MNIAMMCAFDANYYKYAKKLINSFLLHNPEVQIHCFAVNCTKYHRRRLKKIGVIVHEKRVKFVSNKNRRCYMSSHRFIKWGKLLVEYPEIERCIALDCDAVVQGSLSHCYDLLDPFDMLLDFNEPFSDEKRFISAGCLVFKNNELVRKFFNSYKATYSSLLKEKERWYNDQRALFKVYEKMKNSMKFGVIPKSINNVNNKSVIQQLRGDRKFQI